MPHLFELHAPFKPSGDQPQAIDKLVKSIDSGEAHSVLLGVTGSGKTYTIANLIEKTGRPAMIMAPNKTLAAQLYREMCDFFPNNRVTYFVSYYDYYQPEAYVPASDTFIEKDASVNECIEQMRLAATKSLIEDPDSIVVATVSAIYGLGDPEAYLAMTFPFEKGGKIDQRQLLRKLAEMQYLRNDVALDRGCYRVRGDVIDIYPADSEDDAIRLQLFDDELEHIAWFDPLTGEVKEPLERFTLYPKTHYVTPRDKVLRAMDAIRDELKERLAEFADMKKLIEEQRLRERTNFDLEMLNELGYCNGIENYSRHLTARPEGVAPPTLMDYLPKNALLIMDESHVMVPQVGGMSRGDRARKENLVQYGFRLPSALDNRPLNFEEFEAIMPQTVYVSATPGDYELEKATTIAEQIVRPTGLVDPDVDIRPVATQVDDVCSEIQRVTEQGLRVLITTLTKKMSENLTEYLAERGIRVRYLHSDIDTVERVEILRDLRLGVFDVLVGINLLREGLDLPEVGLVAIFDADKEGFLRSTRSLIQTVGRAARNVHARAIMYADTITRSMKAALSEMERRREKQLAYNAEHGITPRSIEKRITDILERDTSTAVPDVEADLPTAEKDLIKAIQALEKQMQEKANNLEFETAAGIRDQVHLLKAKLRGE